jgi:uncharacterized membrane protein YdjX (TVP38/TMEM64 family)
VNSMPRRRTVDETSSRGPGAPAWRFLLHLAIMTGLLLLMVALAPVSRTDTLEGIRRFIEHLGWEGVGVYVAVFVVGSMFFVPATALSAVAPLLFGPWLGFVAIVTANMAAAAAMFGLARWAGYRWGWIQKLRYRLPAGLRDLSHGNGLLLIFYARLVMLPASPVTYAASLLPLSFSELWLGTLLGVLPHCLSTALSIGIGRDALLAGSWRAMVRWEVGLLLATYAATLWAIHNIRRRMRDSGRAETAA